MKKNGDFIRFYMLDMLFGQPSFLQNPITGVSIKGKKWDTCRCREKKFNEMLPEYEAIYKGDTKKKSRLFNL
ncbi:hypothetical protein RCO48_03945 [Peribacillus frigoritolerans]|nr:hypothetical protein [Peribacillus frigoritolerans]